MAQDFELERMVVNIIGDPSKFVKALEESKTQTKSATDAMVNALGALDTAIASGSQNIGQLKVQVAESVSAWRRATEGQADLTKALEEAKRRTTGLTSAQEDHRTSTERLTQSLGALSASLSLASRLKQAFNMAMGAETTQVALRSAIEMTGGEVDETTERFNAYAKALSQETGVAKASILATLSQATTMGLSADAAERAAKYAVALGGGVDGATRSMARLAIEAERGDTQRLQRTLPGLRGMHDEVQRNAKAQDLLEKKFAQVAAQTETAAGQLRKLNNEYVGLKVSFGKVIVEQAAPVVEVLRDIVSGFQSLDDTTKMVIVTVAAVIAGFVAFAAVSPYLLGALVMIKGSLLAILGILLNPVFLAFAAILVVVGTVAYAATDGFKSFRKSLDDLNQAMEQSLELNKEWAARFQSSAGRELTSIKTGTPEEQAAKGKAALAVARRELEGYERAVKGARANLSNDDMTYFEQGAKFLWMQTVGRATGLRKAELEELESFEEKRRIALARVRGIEKAIGEAVGRPATEVAKQKVDQFNFHLNQQLATLGMTGDEVKRYKMSLLGLSDTQLAATDKLIERLHMEKEELKFWKDLNQFTDKLTGPFYKDANEQKLHNLEMMADELGLRDEVTKAILANARALVDEKAAQVESNKIKEEGHRIIDKFRLPIEKFNEEMEHLNELMKRGAFDEETYRRAVEGAEKALASSIKPLQKVTGVAADSAQAMSMIIDQMDSFNKLSQAKAAGESATAGAQGVAADSAAAATRMEAQTTYLREIRDMMITQGKIVPVTVNSADFGAG